MSPLAGPLHAAALVLLVAAAAKARRPATAGAALRTLGLLGSRATVRALATAEAAIAVGVLAGVGAPAAALLAAAHAGFAVVAVALRRRSADCGCFGAAVPVTGAHVAVNIVVAVTALAATLDPVGSLGAALAATPALGAPYAILTAALAGAEVLVLTALAELQAATGALRRGAGAAA